jgi:CheY-like chemotaxis protein
MCSTITKWGMKAYPFSSSEEALFFIKVVPFDIGLIDICIPKIDGYTLASKIRQESEFNNKSMPLIALSSLGDKVQDLDKYFQEHIVKPVKESKLRKACISLLNAHKSNSNQKEDQGLCTEAKQIVVTKQYKPKNSDTKILLAEDVYINQKVILGFLSKLGYTNVSVAENGKQVLDIMKTKTFDIILLDIKMPILDGVGVLKILRQHYSNNLTSTKKFNFDNKKIPYIVAITAYCLKEDKEKYINMGFDDYLPKPIQIHELENCLNSYQKTKILEI